MLNKAAAAAEKQPETVQASIDGQHLANIQIETGRNPAQRTPPTNTVISSIPGNAEDGHDNEVVGVTEETSSKKPGLKELDQVLAKEFL